MKQKKSLSSKGQIEIKTQKPSYYSNETIIGWVFLNVKETGFKAGIVRLRFVGKARSTHTFDDLDYGQFSQLNKKFLNSSVDLHDYGKILPIVQIVFPFEISLNLFASSLQIGLNQDETIIEFYLVSEVVNQKNKLDTQIKFKLPIKINKGFHLTPISMYNIFRGDLFYCYCCFRKNIYTIIKMNFLKNEFQKFESIKIHVDIDQSNCSQDMYMSIRLIKTLIIKFLPQTYEKTIEIQKFDYLKCEGLQKIVHTVEFKLNFQQLESTQISTDIQLQYFLEVYIIPFRIDYKFPITIIEPGNLLMDQQIFNYNEQISIVGESVLFDKTAYLHVNQSNFLKQEQILQLSMYNNLQIDGNYIYSNYHVLENKSQPELLGKEVPIIVVQQQKNTLQE